MSRVMLMLAMAQDEMPMEPEGISAAGLAAAGLIGLIGIGFSILMIVSMWKIFTKAGKPGWASLIPIYNLIVCLEIGRKPMWWIFLFLIPFANFVAAFVLLQGVAEAFGKGIGFTLGLIFLPFIFFPLLAFGDAQYS